MRPGTRRVAPGTGPWVRRRIRGLQRMVDEDVYCIDILTQVSA
ncbi:metal-sensitive transcriptional regulator, partial [Streptomyces sp. NPDC049597]